MPVTRFAVRHWSEALVDPEDQEEQRRTSYLLTGNILGLFLSLAAELVSNSVGLVRTLPLWRQLWRAGGGFVRHAGYLLQAINLRRRMRALGIEHLHVHFSSNATSVALLARSLGGAPFSFTVHGPDELVDPRSNALGLKVAAAAFVVAITEYCRERVAAESASRDHDKIRIVRCGIQLGDYPWSNPDAASFRLVCVGRLCGNKGQALIPAAVARVVDDYPQLSVELVGDGEDRALVEQEIARHNLQDRIILSGWRAGSEVTERIRSSRALLLPSFAEGLPIVLMEALALGRPVLTTSIAGIPELVDSGCGWIFPPGNETELVAALRAVMEASAEDLTAKAVEGRARVERWHDVDANARLLIVAVQESIAAAQSPCRLNRPSPHPTLR